jgi:hypothetical protein
LSTNPFNKKFEEAVKDSEEDPIIFLNQNIKLLKLNETS